jgi:hypothetical protein
MSAAGGAPMVASMATSALGSIGTAYAQSQAFKAAGAYQAGLARTNAAMADLAGAQTIEQGDIAAGRRNLQTTEQVGTEKATQAASGVDVGSGSAALVRNGTNLVGAVDEMTIRNNAARQAFGYKIQAINDTSQGQFAQLTAKAQANQTLLSGGLGAISGPLSMYSNYLMWSRRSGMGGTATVPDSYIGNSGVSLEGYMPFSIPNKLSLGGN